MKRALGLALLSLTIGCKAPMATVRFESDPPGAKVYVVYHPLSDLESAKQTASYLGTAPCTGQFRVKGNGEIDPPARVFIASDFVRPQVSFIAEPPNGVTATNQVRTFMGGAMFHPGDKLPEAIMFNFAK